MKHVLVFDVESVGLHGEGYAVGGCLLDLETGAQSDHFRYACSPTGARGAISDRQWIAANIPPIEETHETPEMVRFIFWFEWQRLKRTHPDLVMAAECAWPVEANFLRDCVRDDEEDRRFKGPYPLHEIASFMQAAGMDPMATYDRLPEEEPKHDPLADARQSARLLVVAMREIRRPQTGLFDSCGIPIRIGDLLRRKVECSQELHGEWSHYRVELQAGLPVISYVRSEKETKLPEGSMRGFLSDCYQPKTLLFADDVRNVRPSESLNVVMELPDDWDGKEDS